MSDRRRWLLVACMCGLLISGFHVAAQESAEKTKSKIKAKPASADNKGAKSPVLVLVNGKKITQADLDHLLLSRRVPPEMQADVRSRFLEQLIDTRLIQGYLAERNTTATKEEVDEQVNLVRQWAQKSGKDPDKVMQELGYSEELLREEFAVPLAWKHHVDRVLTAKRVQEYFAEHHQEFDGTQVRASHILIKIAPAAAESEIQEAEEKLKGLRSQILAKKTTFEQAAEAHSSGPSKDQGGDVGWFPWSGKMPEAFSKVAFSLKIGEMSQPFRTRFGMDLCLVTDRKPGELSLEDVRGEVVNRLSQQLWMKTVAEQRATAKIDWKTKPQAPQGTK